MNNLKQTRKDSFSSSIKANVEHFFFKTSPTEKWFCFLKHLFIENHFHVIHLIVIYDANSAGNDISPSKV